MKRRVFKFTLVVLAALLGGGCQAAARRNSGEVPSSIATPIPEHPAGGFSRFAAVDIGTPTAESGGLVPAEFKSQLVTHVRKALTQGKDALFQGVSPTLTIEPHIMWFNKSNSLFPKKYAVVIFLLQGEGAELGSVQIVTKSEAGGTGVDDLAESMAKELARYLRKHGKEPGKRGM